MNEEYLWDRSGPPDPEIERLERTLAPFRLGHRPAAAPVRSAAPWRYAAAAAVVLAAIGAARLGAPSPEKTAWEIAGMEVHRGQVLRTGGAGVRLQSDAVGQVDVQPGSELLAAGGKRLELRRGAIEAFIWAPAREFVVDTPSARAVDLGCRYTLEVDDKGDGQLRVSMGWVAFENAGKESFIPAGAQCRTRKHAGPGIPWFEDASEPFRAALADLERGDIGALPRVLREAGPHDGLSLWHVLSRVRAEDRGAVFDRFSQLVPPAAAIPRIEVMRGDPRAFDRCWDALGLEGTDWWRGWERKWSE
jgi:hypothetical protein